MSWDPFHLYINQNFHHFSPKYRPFITRLVLKQFKGTNQVRFDLELAVIQERAEFEPKAKSLLHPT